MKLEDFRDLVRHNQETRIFWDELVKAAYALCQIDINIEMKNRLQQKVGPESLTLQREHSTFFEGAKKVLVEECRRCDVEVPEFEARDICRLAK